MTLRAWLTSAAGLDLRAPAIASRDTQSGVKGRRPFVCRSPRLGGRGAQFLFAYIDHVLEQDLHSGRRSAAQLQGGLLGDL